MKAGTDPFAEASALLASVRDIVDVRSDGATPPAWCVRRGWVPFLESLSEEALRAAGREGLAAHVASWANAPADLVALAGDVTRLTTLPGIPAASDPVDPRRASPRKRTQVAAFAELTRRLASAPARVVDIGSGHGHLTRHLARALGVPAEGWERDAARVAVASALTANDGPRFVTLDARDASTALGSSDLVVGLHACGELGDHAVRAASEAGASIAIVACCLQKRPGDRAPLVVPPGVTEEALTLGRRVLGFGNARDCDDGVEEDLATRTQARVNRIGLRGALRAAGLEVRLGEEMRGVNRRRATARFEDLVAFAFGLRGLDAPTERAIADAARMARMDYERSRRWELPRTMLARLVEVWVAMDRAEFLRRRGYRSEVVVAFDADASPRNLAVLGARE